MRAEREALLWLGKGGRSLSGTARDQECAAGASELEEKVSLLIHGEHPSIVLTVLESVLVRFS